MNGESVLIVRIRSFAVTGCPFIVPIGVCPSTLGGRGGRGGCWPAAVVVKRQAKRQDVSRSVSAAVVPLNLFLSFIALQFDPNGRVS